MGFKSQKNNFLQYKSYAPKKRINLITYLHYKIQRETYTRSTSGLVVEQYPATVQTRVRFPAGATKAVMIIAVVWQIGSATNHPHWMTTTRCLRFTVFYQQKKNQRVRERVFTSSMPLPIFLCFSTSSSLFSLIFACFEG